MDYWVIRESKCCAIVKPKKISWTRESSDCAIFRGSTDFFRLKIYEVIGGVGVQLEFRSVPIQTKYERQMSKLFHTRSLVVLRG